MSSNDGTPRCHERFAKFWSESVYDSSRGTVFDRTASSWGKITIFYVIFYGCLAGFFAIWMAVFLETLDAYEPKYHGKDSLLGTVPGLGFVPRPDIEKNLIWFNSAQPYTYKPYVDVLKNFLDGYDSVKQPQSTYVKCDAAQRPPEGKVCRFDAKEMFNTDSGDPQGLGMCKLENEFGFMTGQPCVLLKINKMFGWEPMQYENRDDIPLEAQPNYDEDHITVTCEGLNAADKENLGEVRYSPRGGFPRAFYPYMNVDHYIQPLVLVHFASPRRGVLINVECRVWLPNVHHDRQFKQGLAVFELMVD